MLVAVGISVAVGELRFTWEAGRSGGVTCRTNLMTLYSDMGGYTAPATEALPLSFVLAGSELGAMRCPCKRPPCQWSAEGRIEVDYEYVGGALTWDQVRSVERFPLAWDMPGNHADGSRNVLFADGHVELLWKNEFQPMLKEAIQRCGNDDALKARLLPYVAPGEGRDMP